MPTLACLILIATGLLLASRADAHQRPGALHWGKARQVLVDWRTVKRIRERKCRTVPEKPRRGVLANTRSHDRLHRVQVGWKRSISSSRQLRSSCNRIPAWPWLALATCESGRDWDYNGPSGFDGGFQFTPSTWTAARQGITGYTYAWQAPAYIQYLVARSWLARTSWLQWPVCSAQIGAR